MAEKGKIEKLVLRTIEWLSVIASLGFIFGYFFGSTANCRKSVLMRRGDPA